MNKLRKITVSVSAHDLQLAQESAGKGITETVRIALRRLVEAYAQQEARKLRGTFKFTVNLDQLREDRNFHEPD